MRIPRRLYDELVTHAREEAPNECCGMIGARDGEWAAVHPATNSAASPLRYEMEPREQLRIMDAIDDAGLEIGAIYDSHTRSDAEPSQTDITLPFYPKTPYVIVCAKSEAPDVRAWEIHDESVTE